MGAPRRSVIGHPTDRGSNPTLDSAGTIANKEEVRSPDGRPDTIGRMTAGLRTPSA
jgi:hypothetical protein